MSTHLRTDGPIHGRVPRTDTTAARSTTRLAPAPRETDPDWMAQSICANSDDPNVWFPAGNTGFWAVHIEDTKARCPDCPVLAQCERLLKHLEEHGEVAGIWAGTSEADRTSEKQRKQKQAARARYDEKRRAAA